MFVFIPELHSTAWIEHISFSSLVEGHLGYFQVGVFQINLLWTFMCKSAHEHMLSFVLGKYVGVEGLGYMAEICLYFKKLLNCFLKWL